MIPGNSFYGLTRSSASPHFSSLLSSGFADRGELLQEEQERLRERFEAEFEIETANGVQKTTLLNLFQSLIPAEAVSLKIVGSYVYKILGDSFVKRILGESSFDSREPNDIDFRVYLDPFQKIPLKELNERLQKKLQSHFGSEVCLIKCNETQDGKNECLTLGIGVKDKLIAEVIFVRTLVRENLFVKDALHLNLPLEFLKDTFTPCGWSVTERTVKEVVEQWMKRQIAISSPAQVNRRGWGRLVLELSKGGELVDEQDHLILLRTALISFRKNLSGEQLASLLPPFSKLSSDHERLEILETAWKCLSRYQESKEVPYYNLEHMESMVRELLKNPFKSALLICKLNPTSKNRDELLGVISDSLPLDPQHCRLLQEHLPELVFVTAATDSKDMLIRLVKTAGWIQEAWSLYQKIHPPGIPTHKFLLGAVRASPEMGIRFLSTLDEVSKEDKNEALELFFNRLPPTPVSLPIPFLIAQLGEISSEALKKLLGTEWLSKLIVDEALDKKRKIPQELCEWGFKHHPRRSELVSRLPDTAPHIKVDCPLTYLSFHTGKATLFKAASLLKNCDTPSTLFLFQEYRKQQATLEPQILKLAREELCKRAKLLSEAELLDALKELSFLEQEILIQEAERLRGSERVQSRVDELLLNIKKHLENGPQKSLLIRLFKKFPSRSPQVWTTWLKLAQTHPKLKEYTRDLLELFIKNPLKKGSESELKTLISLLLPISLSEKCPFILSWLLPLGGAQTLTAALEEKPIASLASLEPTLKLLAEEIETHKEPLALFREYFSTLYSFCKRLFIQDRVFVPLIPLMNKEDLELFAGDQEATYSDPFVLVLLKNLLELKGGDEAVLRTLSLLFSRDAKLKGALLAIKNPSLFIKALSQNLFLEVLSEKPLATPLSTLLKTHFLECYRLENFKRFVDSPSQNSLMEAALLELFPSDFFNLNFTDTEFEAIRFRINTLSPAFKGKMVEKILTLDPHKAKDYTLLRQRRILEILESNIGHSDCRTQKNSTLARCYRWILSLHKDTLTLYPAEWHLKKCQINALFKGTGQIRLLSRKHPYRSQTTYKTAASAIADRLGSDWAIMPLGTMLYMDPSILDHGHINKSLEHSFFLFDLVWEEYLSCKTIFQIDLLDTLVDQLIFYTNHLDHFDNRALKEYWIRFRQFYSHPLPHHELFERHQQNCQHIFRSLSSMNRPSYIKDARERETLKKYLQNEISEASVWLCMRLKIDSPFIEDFETFCFNKFVEGFSIQLKRLKEPDASNEVALIHLANLLFTFCTSDFFRHSKDEVLSRCYYDFYEALKAHPETLPVIKIHCSQLSEVFMLQPLLRHVPTHRLDLFASECKAVFQHYPELIQERFFDPLYMNLRIALEKLNRGCPIDNLDSFLITMGAMLEVEIAMEFGVIPVLNPDQFFESLLSQAHQQLQMSPIQAGCYRKIVHLEKLIYIYSQLLLKLGSLPEQNWDEAYKMAPFNRLIGTLIQLPTESEFKKTLIDFTLRILSKEGDFPYSKFLTTLQENYGAEIEELVPRNFGKDLNEVKSEDDLFNEQYHLLLSAWLVE